MANYINIYIKQLDENNYNEFNILIDELARVIRTKFPTIKSKISYGSDSLEFEDIESSTDIEE